MNKESYHLYKKTFIELLRTDFLIFKEVFAGKAFNMLIWVISNVAVNAYLMPYFGVNESYGPFMVAGTFATIGLFEIYPSAINLISDLQHDRLISYQLLLPLPSTLVFFRLILFYFFNMSIMQLMTLPLSTALVYQRINFNTINIGHLLAIVIIGNFFYASMTLYLATKVTILEKIGNVWSRFLYPLWYLGCYHFSWKALYSVQPQLAYLNLLNPMTWLMEGLRSSFLGPKDFLSFWVAIIVILCMFFLLSWRGIVNLKKRLDCL